MLNGQGRAIVIGASVTGLLAGRVLADFFGEVILVDKEPLDEGPVPRPAVPQGNHIHGILTPLVQVLERFLPGFIDDLTTNGAHLFDGGADWRFHVFGRYLATGTTGRKLIGASRPFFEHRLRDRVREVSSIEIRTDRRLVDWMLSSDHRRVTGVVVRGVDGEVRMEADVVVDARGRGSALPKELKMMRFDPPFEERVRIDLGYTSRLFRSPGFCPDWNLLIVNPSVPRTWTGGLVERIEDGLWIVTQFGYFGDHAPADDVGFLDQARALEAPDVAEFIDRSEPASDFRKFVTRQCAMRRYERQASFPDRLLVMGDAVCALNPIYGQGMCKAAREADFLFESLSAHSRRTASLDGFSHAFRRELPAAGANWAWQLTTGNDLSYPQTIGKRHPVIGPVMRRYMRRLFMRSASSLDARRRLFDVLMLLKPPQHLFDPRMMVHALGY